MTIDPKGFPLDLSGENKRNLILNDTRVIASNDDTVFVPDGGPFFTRSLVVKSGTTILKPNVDYKCLHLLRDATVESGLDVSAVIMITNTTISSVSLNYQVIGGQYADTVPAIRQLLENADNIEKSISWHTHVYAKPDLFEPAPHFVSGEDFSDWSAVLNGIRAIERAILLKDVAAWESAFQYMDNLVTHRIGELDLSNFYTRSEVNGELVKLALRTSVYTKTESDARYYNKAEVNALIGDIDGNETYYTETEINAKFIETTVADAKYSTRAELNRVDTAKADKSSVYTRVQSDDKFPLKINIYHKDYIDANFVIKGTSFTKAESDDRYAYKTDAYTKVDSDKRYALKSQIPTTPDLSQFMNRGDIDSTYLKINAADVIYIRKTTADSLYAKHTDLDIIETLSNKFNKYYTKVETDEKFITATNTHSIFLTKAQGNSLYYNKTYSASTFATKKEVENEVSALNTNVAKKADSLWVDNTYYNKVASDKRYYTQSDSDNRFHTKQHVDRYFVTNTKLTNTLEDYVTVGDFTLTTENTNSELDNRYTKFEINDGFYTKSFVDRSLVFVNTFNSKVAELETTINLKSNTKWVNDNFYDKSQADARYYTKTTTDNNFYNKQESDSRFLHTSTFNSEIKKYVPTSKLNTEVARLNSELNDRYTKSETYSKSESESRYLPTNLGQLTLNGSSTSPYSLGLVIKNNHSSSTVGGSLQWYNKDQRTGMIYNHLDTSTNATRLTYYLHDQARNQWSYHVIMGINGLWHRQYGWLHDYFSIKGDTYSKSEVYSKSESDARYYTKTHIDRTYTTVSNFNTTINSVNSTLGAKANTSWVNSNFYSKSEMSSLYWNKTDIDRLFYSKVETDNTFSTINYVKAEIAKQATDARVSSEVTKLNNTFNNYYSKTEGDKRYATIATTNLKSDTKWVNDNFYSKSESDSRYYTKSYSSATFAKKSEFTSEQQFMRREIADLRSKIETYKIGDIYITTTNFATSTSVNRHHGYGTWERYGLGRTLVGYSPNGYSVSSWSGHPSLIPLVYRAETQRFGETFGTFYHKLNVDEMPAHRHMVRHGYDNGTVNRDGGGTAASDTWNWSRQHLGVNTVEESGGSQYHENAQPSIVVGMWKRIK